MHNKLKETRTVVNANTDTVVQRTMYYASGVPMAENLGPDVPPSLYHAMGVQYTENFGRDEQPYLYNGKEFIESHGWNTYDYGFRGYYAPTGRFTSIDPLAEQTPWQSPYAYAGNNFINNIDWMGLSGVTSMANGNAPHYIVIGPAGEYLGGVNNDDWSIYIDPDGNWKPKDGKDDLERVGRMIFPFWVYDNWIGGGGKAPGIYYGNSYSISVSVSIGWQVSAEKIFQISCPSLELINATTSMRKSSDGFEWKQPEFDYIGNNYEYKTTLGVQFLLGYEYSIAHNVWIDLPNMNSLTHTLCIGPVSLNTNGTYAISLSFAFIGGISISIIGDLYYESN